MTSSPRDSSAHDAPLEDGDTYRLLPPAEKASAPAERNEAQGVIDDSAEDPAKPRKRRKRAATTEPPAATDAPAAEGSLDEAYPEWKPDTGWQDPPLASALWFPFAGGGWKVLVVYSVFLWLATILPLVGSVIGFFVMVFHSVLLLETANYVLEGIPGGPRFPELLSWDTISAGLMGLVVFVIAGAPVLIGTVIAIRLGAFPPALRIGLVSVALFYLPIAFVALAEQQNERALNPLLVLRGIRRIAVPYAILCGAAALGFLLPQYILLWLEPPLAVQLAVFSLAWMYVSIALLRAVALVARKRKLTFE